MTKFFRKSKKAYLGPFFQNLGKNEFSWKKDLCRRQVSKQNLLDNFPEVNSSAVFVRHKGSFSESIYT